MKPRITSVFPELPRKTTSPSPVAGETPLWGGLPGFQQANLPLFLQRGFFTVLSLFFCRMEHLSPLPVFAGLKRPRVSHFTPSRSFQAPRMPRGTCAALGGLQFPSPRGLLLGWGDATPPGCWCPGKGWGRQLEIHSAHQHQQAELGNQRFLVKHSENKDYSLFLLGFRVGSP